MSLPIAEMRFNGPWWADYIQGMIIRDFSRYADVVKKRLLPVFDKIGEEAEEFANKKYQEYAAHLDTSEADQYDAEAYYTDKALDEGVAYQDTLVAMYFTTLSLFTAGLFHLLEQHSIELYLEILDHHGIEEVKLGHVTEWLRSSLSIDVRSFKCWDVIDELRLVANSVKHGEGRSAQDLRVRRPDLFVVPAYRNGLSAPQLRPNRVRKPLFGEDLYLTVVDFDRYCEGVLSFWAELSDAMRATRL